jgi:cysteine desulfurase
VILYNSLMPPIYLDYNATTPLLPEAWEAMRPLMTEAFGNSSSAHQAGRKARQALEDARERLASLLGAFPDEVTFTSGATEANNLAILSLACIAPPRPARFPSGTGGVRGGASLLPPSPREGGLGGEGNIPRQSLPGGEGQREGSASILTSHLEHPCVVEPLRHLEARGIGVEWLPLSPRGVLLATTVQAATRAATRLVCTMLANHETGALQPVREIAAALPPGIALHCDAAQAVGKIPVDFHNLGATTLTASAHKFGGPQGIGVLVAKRGTPLSPLMFGGHQQQGRRPGTEPVALAVGMATALAWATRNLTENLAKLQALRQRLWSRLLERAPPLVLNGPEIGAPDVVPTTLNVSFPGCRADLLLLALDMAGVACSTGSACSSGSLLPSPVLAAMGVPEEVLRSALRFSLGSQVEFADIDEAAVRIGSAVARARETF